MELDRKDLKNQALLEKVSSLTTQYEDQIANLRVELTVVELEKQELLRRIEELESVEHEVVSEEETAK